MPRSWEDDYSPEIVEAVKNRDYSSGADAIYMNDEDYAKTLYNKSLWDAADEAGRSALHDSTEAIRATYGYSGGGDGSQYNRLTQTSPYGQPFTYENAPSFTDKYTQQLDALTQQYLTRDPFDYDYTQDPRWQAYKKEYTREGRRATEDAMGQYAAMTGGMPSTAAVTAAQQAGDYYNARMTDKIPELYDAAYQMWLNEGDQQLQGINLLRGLRGDDQDWYGQEWNRGYQLGRDQIGDVRYGDETAYGRAWNEDERDYARQQDAQDRILALISNGISADRIPQDLYDAAGLTSETVRGWAADMLANAAAGRSSGGGGSGGSRRSSGSNSSKESTPQADSLSNNPRYIANEAARILDERLQMKGNDYEFQPLWPTTPAEFLASSALKTGNGNGTGSNTISDTARGILSNIQRGWDRRGDKALTDAEWRNLNTWVDDGTISEAELNWILDRLGV